MEGILGSPDLPAIGRRPHSPRDGCLNVRRLRAPQPYELEESTDGH
jgi:hypothetical protein